MANHALPTTTDLYANVLTYLHARIDDSSKWYDSALAYTNAPTGVVQWDSTALNWKKNTGTAGAPVWTVHSTAYNININGTVGATTASTGAFTTLTTSGVAGLGANSTVGGNTIAHLGSTAQTFTGSMSFTNASPIVSAKIGPAAGQQHTIPAVTSDTVALIAASQTFTNKTYSGGAFTGTLSGNHTLSGQVSFTEATAPIISARIGPSSTQQHTLPVVASDTIALLAATQTFTNKTLTSPSISGGSITNAPISGSTGSFTSLTSTSGYVQSPGLSTSYGVTGGTSTGAYNAVMGTAASATWLLSGTSGGTFRYGIQGLDSGGVLRIYTGTSWLNFDGINLTNSSSHTFVTSANYNTYAPTLTGTGASGSWNINAATVTNGVYTNSSASISGNNYITFGPNSTWSGYLRIGGNGRTASGVMASIATTNGNLHIDAATGAFSTYLNYYAGTSGILFGNGASGIVAVMGPDGDLWKGSADNTGTQYVYNSGTWGINVTGTAGSISGFNNPTTASTANTIVYRDANGYIQNNYFYTSGGGSERNASGMGYFSGHNTGDYYIRSYTAAAAAALLSGQTMNINGSSTSCSGNAASVTINYSNDSASTYQMLWGSGNGVYGTAGIYCNPSTDQLNVGILYSSGNVTAYSDERVKTNWRDLGSDFVSKLAKVKSGVYDRTDTQLTQVGVSAQSLQPVIPAAVDTDEEGKLSVAYGHAALASAIMLARKVEELEARLALLEGK